MTLIPPPPAKHDCLRHLPWSSGGYGSTGVPDGTIAVCSCGRAWVSAPCYESLGPTEAWYRIRWYHWRLRRRIERTTA